MSVYMKGWKILYTLTDADTVIVGSTSKCLCIIKIVFV